MGLKYSNIQTVGELRQALAAVADDVPFEFITPEDESYREAEVQSLYDGKPEQFVRIKIEA